MQLISSVTFTNVSYAKIQNGSVETIIKIANNAINGIHSVEVADITEDDYNRLEPTTEHDGNLLNAIENNKNSFAALNASITQ